MTSNAPSWARSCLTTQRAITVERHGNASQRFSWSWRRSASHGISLRARRSLTIRLANPAAGRRCCPITKVGRHLRPGTLTQPSCTLTRCWPPLTHRAAMRHLLTTNDIVHMFFSATSASVGTTSTAPRPSCFAHQKLKRLQSSAPLAQTSGSRGNFWWLAEQTPWHSSPSASAGSGAGHPGTRTGDQPPPRRSLPNEEGPQPRAPPFECDLPALPACKSRPWRRPLLLRRGCCSP